MASQYPPSIGCVSALPLATALSVIPSLPRPLLARLVERAIERLDEIDGDEDVELNGDELDGSHGAEDEFQDHWLAHTDVGAGCPVSDPAEDQGDAEPLLGWSGYGS